MSKSSDLNNSLNSINIIEKIAITLIPGCPEVVRAPLIIICFVSILAILSLFCIKQPTFSFIILIITIIGVFIITFIILLFPERINKYNIPKAKNTKHWSRNLPRLPLTDDETRKKIYSKLYEILQCVYNDFKEKYNDVRIEQFRANIFTAEYGNVEQGDVCSLKIRNYFKINMENYQDHDIEFRPGQGATGKCFIEHKADIALCNEKWEEKYLLPCRLEKKIYDKLSWIITYPLLDKSKNAIAILNIDCIEFDLTQNNRLHLQKILKKIQTKHQEKVDRISKLFDRYPKVTVSILVEDFV